MARRFTAIGASPSISPDVAKRMCAFAIEPPSQQGWALSRLRFAANGLDGPPLARLELGKQLGPGENVSHVLLTPQAARLGIRRPTGVIRGGG